MKRILLSILLLVAVALLLAACFPTDQTPTPEPAPTETPTQAPPTAAPTEAPKVEPAASARVFGEAWESVACDTFNVGPEVAAVADCGYVTVPENRATGSDKQIKLAVVRVKSTNEKPGAPILLGTGGPGSGGLGNVQGAGGPGFLTTYGPILQDRDFVLFSQRGTAPAQPTLDCPAYNALTFEASTKGMSLEETGQATKAALVKCAEAFKAQGVDLAAYNSVENADDVDAIRQTLGYDKLFYYGESYGTQLGQFVLRRHPDILAGIMLDGIVPVTKEKSVQVSDIPGAFRRVFDACAADQACNAAYPDLEKMLTETIYRLAKNPMPYKLELAGQNPIDLKVDDLLAMNALFIDLYVPGGYGKLPEYIKQLHDGNPAPLAATLPFVLADSDNARVMHYAINCTDDPTTSMDDLGLKDIPAVYARFVASDGQNYAGICPALALPQLPADSDALVKSDLPALLIQGGLDPATPRSGGLTLVEGLPNSTEVLVPSGNHVQFGNPCVVDIVAKFMNDPAAKPDLSCIDPTIAFQYPAPAPFAGPGASTVISITLPPTFMVAGPGQWSDNTMIVLTSSYPVTKTVDMVLAETAAMLKLQNPEAVDGPTIAGMKSKLVQAPPFDIYVFGDEQGAYRVIFDTLDAARADLLQKTVYPNLLASVTVGPAPAQVIEPAAVPPPTEELAQLRANSWQWVSYTGPTETFEIETPERYTVTFNTDASLAITADCNRAAGSYQGEGGKLTVEIGPVTAAACPPESRSEQFLKLLGGGTQYFFRDGSLYIDLLADGGTMIFAPASAASGTQTTAEASNTPRLRALDFAPFEKQLAGFTPERAAAVDAIVKGADIAQVQDAVKAGKLTYAELTLYFLARIQQYDETLRTMVELNPNALEEAQAADALRKQGKATGPMLGIPVTFKDNIETAAPMHTTGGAEILLNNQPKADASFVKQLREAGAVILGKANLSELAGGVSSQAGFSAVGGQVVNPHGNYSPAGSSAGSGAGTAAYETMVSVGSETSGSLIAPASWNGVVGMYPGHGVVDGANVIPLVKNNDSAGPMGRSVRDVAALLAVIDTQDTDYVAGLDAKALNGVTAAFLKSDVLAQKPSALEDTSDNAAVAQLVEKGLTQAGARVTAIELTPAGIGQQVNMLLGGMLMGGVRHDMVSYPVAAGAPIKTLEDLAAYNLKEPKTRIPTGQGTIGTSLPITQLMALKDYQEFVTQGKELATAVLDAAFADNKADVLVSITNYHSPLYATANYPAISVPLGKRKNGMPVGVTLIGKPGSEAKLLSYAYALEQATRLRVDPDLSQE
jgi:amidase